MHFSSDGRPVGTRIAAALPRIVVVLAGCLLASATIGFAAEVRVKPQRHHTAAAKRHVLVVPDVRRQVFVFAKGMLEDDGFGWKVEGSVHGFAPNRVVSQSPAPGTRVVDTGSPMITLSLERDTSYAQEGSPEDRSPYTATKITRVLRVKAKAHKVSTRHVKARPAGRTPAFVVSGAPSEPTGTPSLPTHARRLAVWIKRHPSASDAHVRHWLSEHAWITTGARFGWWGGAQALKTLIRVDRQAEHLWGLGVSNRKVAEQTLRFVRAHSG
jgi:PASTA domain